MMARMLVVDIQSFWQSGGGRGQGAVLDATAHRDADGLPVLPGRHLKGLLREALEAAECWQWQGYEGLAAKLFGDRTEEVKEKAEEAKPAPGCLRISDAALPDQVTAYLAGENGEDLVSGLFRTLYTTAVEHDSGAARDKSLRGIEVVVPLRLTARIEPVSGIEPSSNWLELDAVLPLVRAVGAYRSRGLGRARLSLEKLQ